ncbi:MAG: hypothetical protein ACTSU9_00845 [Promethearchaeota archaeon]
MSATSGQTSKMVLHSIAAKFLEGGLGIYKGTNMVAKAILSMSWEVFQEIVIEDGVSAMLKTVGVPEDIAEELGEAVGMGQDATISRIRGESSNSHYWSFKSVKSMLSMAKTLQENAKQILSSADSMKVLDVQSKTDAVADVSLSTLPGASKMISSGNLVNNLDTVIALASDAMKIDKGEKSDAYAKLKAEHAAGIEATLEQFGGLLPEGNTFLAEAVALAIIMTAKQVGKMGIPGTTMKDIVSDFLTAAFGMDTSKKFIKATFKPKNGEAIPWESVKDSEGTIITEGIEDMDPAVFAEKVAKGGTLRIIDPKKGFYSNWVTFLKAGTLKTAIEKLKEIDENFYRVHERSFIIALQSGNDELITKLKKLCNEHIQAVKDGKANPTAPFSGVVTPDSSSIANEIYDIIIQTPIDEIERFIDEGPNQAGLQDSGTWYGDHLENWKFLVDKMKRNEESGRTKARIALEMFTIFQSAVNRLKETARTGTPKEQAIAKQTLSNLPASYYEILGTTPASGQADPGRLFSESDLISGTHIQFNQFLWVLTVVASGKSVEYIQGLLDGMRTHENRLFSTKKTDRTAMRDLAIEFSKLYFSEDGAVKLRGSLDTAFYEAVGQMIRILDQRGTSRLTTNTKVQHPADNIYSKTLPQADLTQFGAVEHQTPGKETIEIRALIKCISDQARSFAVYVSRDWKGRVTLSTNAKHVMKKFTYAGTIAITNLGKVELRIDFPGAIDKKNIAEFKQNLAEAFKTHVIGLGMEVVALEDKQDASSREDNFDLHLKVRLGFNPVLGRALINTFKQVIENPDATSVTLQYKNFAPITMRVGQEISAMTVQAVEEYLATYQAPPTGNRLLSQIGMLLAGTSTPTGRTNANGIPISTWTPGGATTNAQLASVLGSSTVAIDKFQSARDYMVFTFEKAGEKNQVFKSYELDDTIMQGLKNNGWTLANIQFDRCATIEATFEFLSSVDSLIRNLDRQSTGARKDLATRTHLPFVESVAGAVVDRDLIGRINNRPIFVKDVPAAITSGDTSIQSLIARASGDTIHKSDVKRAPTRDGYSYTFDLPCKQGTGPMHVTIRVTGDGFHVSAALDKTLPNGDEVADKVFQRRLMLNFDNNGKLAKKDGKFEHSPDVQAAINARQIDGKKLEGYMNRRQRENILRLMFTSVLHQVEALADLAAGADASVISQYTTRDVSWAVQEHKWFSVPRVKKTDIQGDPSKKVPFLMNFLDDKGKRTLMRGLSITFPGNIAPTTDDLTQEQVANPGEWTPDGTRYLIKFSVHGLDLTLVIHVGTNEGHVYTGHYSGSNLPDVGDPTLENSEVRFTSDVRTQRDTPSFFSRLLTLLTWANSDQFSRGIQMNRRIVTRQVTTTDYSGGTVTFLEPCLRVDLKSPTTNGKIDGEPLFRDETGTPVNSITYQLETPSDRSCTIRRILDDVEQPPILNPTGIQIPPPTILTFSKCLSKFRSGITNAILMGMNLEKIKISDDGCQFTLVIDGNDYTLAIDEEVEGSTYYKFKWVNAYAITDQPGTNLYLNARVGYKGFIKQIAAWASLKSFLSEKISYKGVEYNRGRIVPGTVTITERGNIRFKLQATLLTGSGTNTKIICIDQWAQYSQPLRAAGAILSLLVDGADINNLEEKDFTCKFLSEKDAIRGKNPFTKFEQSLNGIDWGTIPSRIIKALESTAIEYNIAGVSDPVLVNAYKLFYATGIYPLLVVELPADGNHPTDTSKGVVTATYQLENNKDKLFTISRIRKGSYIFTNEVKSTDLGISPVGLATWITPEFLETCIEIDKDSGLKVGKIVNIKFIIAGQTVSAPFLLVGTPSSGGKTIYRLTFDPADGRFKMVQAKSKYLINLNPRIIESDSFFQNLPEVESVPVEATFYPLVHIEQVHTRQGVMYIDDLFLAVRKAEDNSYDHFDDLPASRKIVYIIEFMTKTDFGFQTHGNIVKWVGLV